MDKEKRNDQAGYVPPDKPVRPSKPENLDRGYVPPKPPVKPPDKPTSNKK